MHIPKQANRTHSSHPRSTKLVVPNTYITPYPNMYLPRTNIPMTIQPNMYNQAQSNMCNQAQPNMYNQAQPNMYLPRTNIPTTIQPNMNNQAQANMYNQTQPNMYNQVQPNMNNQAQANTVSQTQVQSNQKIDPQPNPGRIEKTNAVKFSANGVNRNPTLSKPIDNPIQSKPIDNTAPSNLIDKITCVDNQIQELKSKLSTQTGIVAPRTSHLLAQAAQTDAKTRFNKLGQTNPNIVSTIKINNRDKLPRSKFVRSKPVIFSR